MGYGARQQDFQQRELLYMCGVVWYGVNIAEDTVTSRGVNTAVSSNTDQTVTAQGSNKRDGSGNTENDDYTPENYDSGEHDHTVADGYLEVFESTQERDNTQEDYNTEEGD